MWVQESSNNEPWMTRRHLHHIIEAALYLLSASYFLGKGRRSIPHTNHRFVKFALVRAWRATRINCCQVYKFLCWQQLKQYRGILENVAYSQSDWCCCRSDLREQITLQEKGGPNAHTISTSLDCNSMCSVCSPTANEAVWGPRRWWLSDQVDRRITLQSVGQICLTRERRSRRLLAAPLTPAKVSAHPVRDISKRNPSNICKNKTKERPAYAQFDHRQTDSTFHWWHLKYFASILEMTMFCYVMSLSLHSGSSWSLSNLPYVLLVSFNLNTFKKPEVKLKEPRSEWVSEDGRVKGEKGKWKERCQKVSTIHFKFGWLTHFCTQISILPASWISLL